MRAYSMDRRQRALAACDEGLATAEPAEALAVSPAWVRRLERRRRLRAGAERAVDRLWSTIGRLLDRFTPAEGRSYFRHCGYHATPT